MGQIITHFSVHRDKYRRNVYRAENNMIK